MTPMSALPPKRKRRLALKVLLVLLALLAVPATAAGVVFARLRSTLMRSVPAPEAATGLRAVPEQLFQERAVVAAHPDAARLGAEVLEKGGSAIDAAVAVQAALTLVEPQSSGLGGGAFLLYFHAPSKALVAFDGRETAPAAAAPGMFLDPKGQPLSFPRAMVGGQSVGVPGVVRMLEAAHRKFGKRPWAELFDGPIALAEQGFIVNPRLHALLKLDPVLPAIAATRGYFYGADGWALPAGARRDNRPLADTFRALASGGADALYRGPLAQEIVAAVQGARRPTLARGAFNLVVRELGIAAQGEATEPAPGRLTAEDLAGYQAQERAPLCVPYHRFKVCSAPPPAGGASVLQLLALLEPLELGKLAPGSAEELHLFLQAAALVEADRGKWLADPAFAPVPLPGLLDPGYLAQRRKLISTDRRGPLPQAGSPPGAAQGTAPGRAPELPSTSHFVAVDAEGSVASVTTSIEFGFGAHVMVGGFLLNNQLTDFAFTPEKGGEKVFNAVAPGKRPRSAMSPVIVFEGEQPVLALGSPGGPRIVPFVARALINVLDHGLAPNPALAQPHVVFGGGKAEVEDVGWSEAAAREALVRALREKGHEVWVGAQNSGLHALSRTPKGWVPGVDPRREGAAFGH